MAVSEDGEDVVQNLQLAYFVTFTVQLEGVSALLYSSCNVIVLIVINLDCWLLSFNISCGLNLTSPGQD